MGGGGEDLHILNTVLQDVTLPECLCHRKVAPIKLIEKFIQILSRVSKEKNCSEVLISNMEAFTCAIYIKVNNTGGHQRNYREIA